MLPESNPFSDDTTMKSSNSKGSFEDLYFLMEKLENVLEGNKGDGTIALALLKFLSKNTLAQFQTCNSNMQQKDTNDLAVCTLAADILLKLLEKPRSVYYKILTTPKNYAEALNLLQQVFCNVFDNRWHCTGCCELHLKLLNSLERLQTKRPRFQYSCVSEKDVIFIGHMLSQYSNCKEHSQILLNLVRQICKSRQFCQVLRNKSFFDSLAMATMLTHEYESAVRIIRCMHKCSEALIEMKNSDNMVPLMSSLINLNVGTNNMKRQLIAVLYKIVKKVPAKLSNSFVWNNLLEYFKSNEKHSEKWLHMSVIKIYTLLNLASERRVIPTTSLAYDPNLPRVSNQNANDTLYEDSENDNDYTDDEDDDEYNKNQESDSSDEESDDDLEESEDEVTVIDSSDEDVLCMSCYFVELNKKLNKIEENDRRNGTFNIVRRGKYIETHAYPDAVAAEANSDDDGTCIDDSTNNFDVSHLVKKLRAISNSNIKTVFNLDSLLEQSNNNFLPSECCFEVNHGVRFSNSLIFESRFESGNLRIAQQVDNFEYDLFLTPDIGTCRGKQWFYFEVSNMIANVPYVFNIVNFDKINSQFNYGMQPVLFSTKEHILSGSGWKRVGEKIVYYGNHYTNEDHSKQYRSLMFTLKFSYDNDKCYLAYHYPYTYTRLKNELYYFIRAERRDVYVRMDNLCWTIKNNSVPLITITSKSSCVPIEKRPIVFLSARVHPGESNSSWIMRGVLKCLFDENTKPAITAREQYVFKIIPMLNPEGVIFGNTRSGLNGCDLNRCWKSPSKYLHPEIYYAKKLVEYAKKHLNHPIFTFIDIHGHSRKKYFFFYGCNPNLSWNKMDKWCEMNENFQIIPDAMAFDENMKSSFCQYKIDKKKEATCRVVMWREFGIENSLTLECSYCSGENKKKITTTMLEDIGRNLITALANIATANSK